jgi:hypothetical protein
MNHTQIMALAPILCGLVLLLFSLLRHSLSLKSIRPTLLVTGGCILIHGLLDLVIADPDLRRQMGRTNVIWMEHIETTLDGISLGAVLTSVLYGHMKSAWLALRRTEALNGVKKTST